MGVDEIQSGGCAPVTEQPGFDVVNRQGAFEQGIIFEIDLADGKVICRAPVGVHFFNLLDLTGHS